MTPDEDPIVARVERKLGLPGLARLLGDALSPSELTPVLLAVARRQAARRRPKDVLAAYERDAFVQPCDLTVEQLRSVDEIARRAAAGFEPIELSPVSPLGTSSSLGLVHQNNVLTTVRMSEVLSDPTNMMALESARRRRASTQAVRLQACCRVVRGARVSGKAFSQHFGLFALSTAGRRAAGVEFEGTALADQIEVLISILGKLAVGPVTVGVEGDERLVDAVAQRVPNVRVESRPERESDYYEGGAFKVNVGDYEVADGGFVPWTQTLLGDRKERFLISGLGSERVCRITRRGS